VITLTFSRASPHFPVSVRAKFFRICADSTLRGPDSSVIATYSEHRWKLGTRGCHEFHCSDPVYLRVTDPAGKCERLGPYEFVRAAEGALFTNGRCLGAHSPAWNGQVETHCWHEITLLSATDGAA
jgi:hypothetical protein